MTVSPTVWGIHMGAHVGNKPIDENYIAIGWHELGDLRELPKDREVLKSAIQDGLPDVKPGAVPVYAGLFIRYVDEMQVGDIVIYPSKQNRMVNIGRVTGDTSYVAGDPDEYPNRRAVEWILSRPRDSFSQSALHEIGSAVTLFKVQRHVAEFLRVAGLTEEPPENVHDDDTTDDDTAAVSVSQQAEETTEDFIIRRITRELSGHEFEEFVAHVMTCMGYTARVTSKSGDGGVDVIAHMDALGFQPPIIKVQCKRRTDQTGEPEVNQLLGTLGEGEYGLFINLGSYSRAAVLLERNRSKLRLIDGEQFVEMVLKNYSALSPRYRSLIPLKQIYVPDLPKG